MVSGLQPGITYAFHVRAFYYNGSIIIEGEATTEILVEIEDQVVLPPGTLEDVNDIVDTDTNDILIGVPSVDAFSEIGVNNIQ